MLSKEKGTKQKSAFNTAESRSTQPDNTQGTDEAIQPDEEEVSPFDQQIQQIFELADICKGIAEDLYPLPDDCSEEERLVLMQIRATCHMELFRAIVGNATTMVSSLQNMASGMGLPPGIVVAQPGGGAGVVMVQPPGTIGGRIRGG